MYRHGADTKQENLSSFLGFNGLNGLNMKCLQELQLDTRTPLPGCASISPTSTSSSRTQFSSTEVSPTAPISTVQQPQQAHLSNLSATTNNGIEAALRIPKAIGTADYSMQLHQSVHQLQQHQRFLHQQQQLAAAAMAEHQLALAAAVSSNQQQDEISQSLKMFAMLTAYTTGNEPTHPQSPVDAIMQDFASNGYICDELNRFQQYQAAINCASNNHANSIGMFSSSANSGGNPLLHQSHINMNLNDVRNQFWKMLPNMQHHSHVATTAAAAVNMDYNCYNNNMSSSNKKPPKRYNNAKCEKYSSVKHCVFCENNNEPEAVVKSHAVRDSLGRVLCPKLRTYICPICKASGDKAHTVKYCPQKPIITMEDAIKAESFRLAKNNYYKQQMKV